MLKTMQMLKGDFFYIDEIAVFRGTDGFRFNLLKIAKKVKVNVKADFLSSQKPLAAS